MHAQKKGKMRMHAMRTCRYLKKGCALRTCSMVLVNALRQSSGATGGTQSLIWLMG